MSASCWNLRVSAEASQGGRKYMEDVALVRFENEHNVEYAVFGIFDGHGGRQASLFAKAHLMNFIRQQKCFWSSRPENVKKAIRDGFIACHEAMRRKLVDWPKTMMGHHCTAGTTASIAIIRGNRLYIAHVGDSGIVLGYENNPNSTHQTHSHATGGHGSSMASFSGTNVPNSSGPAYSSNCKSRTNYFYRELTTDHKPETPAEKRRIESAGGAIANKSGVNRVIWNRPRLNSYEPIVDRIPFLAVARSLGDLWSYSEHTNQFVVSPVPDIDVVDLTSADEIARFVIVGSDGVWNMIRPWDAVHSVATFDERKKNNKTSGSPAHDLVDEALRRWRLRGLRADNTSAVVVWLDRYSGSSQGEFVNRVWSSDRAEREQSTSTAGSSPPSKRPHVEPPPSRPSVREPVPLETQEEDEEESDENEEDFILDADDSIQPALYPSNDRMKRYADLTIPPSMLDIISDDDDEDQVSSSGVALSSSTIPKRESRSSETKSEPPVQDNEISSTTKDEEDEENSRTVSSPKYEKSSSSDPLTPSTSSLSPHVSSKPHAASSSSIKRIATKRSSSDSDKSTNSNRRLSKRSKNHETVDEEKETDQPETPGGSRRRSMRLVGQQNVTRSKSSGKKTPNKTPKD